MKNGKIIRQINRVVRDMHEKYKVVSELFLNDNDDSHELMTTITDKDYSVSICELYKTLLYNYLMDVKANRWNALTQYERYARELLCYLNKNDTDCDYEPYLNNFGLIRRIGYEAFFEIVFLKSSLFRNIYKHN